MPGNTGTGGVLEAMVLPALDRAGYRYRTQVIISDRLGCGRHVVDAIAEKVTELKSQIEPRPGIR
jgi:hypothetical protein